MAKDIKDFIQTKVTYDKEGQYFWAVQKDGNLQMMGELRGWGHIQNMFRDKSAIDFPSAEAYQDQLGQFIADAINEKLTKV